MIQFNFITDDGHGWLEVSLIDYPYAKEYATGSGYINGNTIYLEEDDEAPAFLSYLKDIDVEFSFIEKNYDGQWYGRSYARNVPGLAVKLGLIKP